MSLNIITRRGLAGIAAACLVSVALPAVPAMAQKTKTKPAEQTTASEPAEFAVSIPTVDAVDSSIDAETIKASLRRHFPDLAHVTVEVAVCADCT